MTQTKERNGYGKGNEAFYIAQGNLTIEEVSNALKNIIADTPFGTVKEDITNLTRELSLHFPDATVFGQDCREDKWFILCYENGKPSTNYSAAYETLTENLDHPGYYTVEIQVFAKNGYNFYVGGEMIEKESISMFNEFICNGNLTYEKEDTELY